MDDKKNVTMRRYYTFNTIQRTLKTLAQLSVQPSLHVVPNVPSYVLSNYR